MLRVSAGSHDWTEVTVVLATVAAGDPPPLAFALIRYDAPADGPTGSSRETQLESHMLRIADELHAAGLIPRLQQLPPLSDEPRLGKLTSREWAVLTRLLDGQRVSAMAADLSWPGAPVRNHLSSNYAKFGVTGRSTCIRLMRRETSVLPGNGKQARLRLQGRHRGAHGQAADPGSSPTPARQLYLGWVAQPPMGKSCQQGSRQRQRAPTFQ